MGEVRNIFTGEEINPFAIDTSFSKSLAPDVIGVVSEFGLQDELLGVLAAHLSNLHVVMTPTEDKKGSRLSLWQDPVNDEYRRLALIDPKDIAARSNSVRIEAKSQGLRFTKETGDKIGIDWAFYELSGDALSNSVYMQNRFERYINDTEVQSGFQSNLHVVKGYLTDVADDFSAYELLVAQTRLKRGLSLEMLPDSIVRNGATDNLKKAEWITSGLREKYPGSYVLGEVALSPMTTQEISHVIASTEVRPAFQEAIDYSNRYPDISLFDDDFDYDDTPSSGILYPIRE